MSAVGFRDRAPGTFRLPPLLAMLLGVREATRTYVEQVVEAGIDALDRLDGDPDLEDDDPPEDTDAEGWIQRVSLGRSDDRP